MKKAAKPGPPQTLMQAHEELVRIRPSPKASLPVWLSYYQRSVEVYEQIAKTDPRHDGEALYWATRERVHARGIEAGSKDWEQSSNHSTGTTTEKGRTEVMSWASDELRCWRSDGHAR